MDYLHIYKVQRPIVSTEENPQFLLYNHDRSFVRYLELDEDAIKEFFLSSSYKEYVIGIPAEETVEILGVLSHDDWPSW